MQKHRNILLFTTRSWITHSLRDSLGTSAALLRGGSTWRHHPAPYHTHTHTRWWSCTVYVHNPMYDLCLGPLLWPSYQCCEALATQFSTISTKRIINYSWCCVLPLWGHHPIGACFSSVHEYCPSVAIRLLRCLVGVALQFPRHDGAGDSHIWRSDPFQVSRLHFSLFFCCSHRHTHTRSPHLEIVSPLQSPGIR